MIFLFPHNVQLKTNRHIFREQQEHVEFFRRFHLGYFMCIGPFPEETWNLFFLHTFGCGASPLHASRAGRAVGWDLGDEEPRARPTDPCSGRHAGIWTALHTSSPESPGAFKGRRVGSIDGRPPPGELLGGPERTASATSRWLTYALDEPRRCAAFAAAVREIVLDVKEKLCYITLDYETELQTTAKDPDKVKPTTFQMATSSPSTTIISAAQMSCFSQCSLVWRPEESATCLS